MDMSLRDLELRHLQALVAVAEERSFGRAATRLGFTQSAVSQQIAGLERVLGASVFDRPGGPKRVELTPLGELVLDHARAILERVRLVEDELERWKAGEAGRLVIGTFQSVSMRVLPEILGRLRSERPKVDVRLVETDDDQVLIDGVVSGELDAAFVVRRPPGEHIQLVNLCEDGYVLVAPADAEAGPVPLSRLGEVPLVGQSASCMCQLAMDRGLTSLGVTPNYVFRSNDNGTVQAMVRAGVGYAVLPGLAVDASDTSVSFHELDPPLPSRRISLAARTDRTRAPVLDRFVELAVEVCEGLVV